MPNKTLKIGIIAGEDSGDLLGASLMQDFIKIYPHCEFIGVGGDKMLAQGLNRIVSNKEFAIMGLVEVISKLPRLLKLRHNIIKQLKAQNIGIFIGVDAPDLNFPIEKKLKKQGVKIIHYVSPSIWAWRPNRAIWISQLTDLVLTLFPFEPSYYQREKGQALFVGHPLAQNIALTIDKKSAKKQLGLDVNRPVLAVLPGSRNNELKAHTEIFLKTAAALQKLDPKLQIISANTNRSKIRYIQEAANRQQLKIGIHKDASAVLKAANSALLASGTVALEAMLCKTAMVVGYKISPFTYKIVKSFKMMLLPYYSLPNVLYGGFLVPEVLQNSMTSENLLQELIKVSKPHAQEQFRLEFTRLHQDLLSPEFNAAIAVKNFIEQQL